MQTRTTLRRLLQVALPQKSLLALTILLGVATVGSALGLMATSAYLISLAALHTSIAALSLAIVGVRFFGIARGVFRYLERLVSHDMTLRLLANFRVWFYHALEPLVPARLLELRQQDARKFGSSDLLTRMIADIEVLQNFYVRVLAPPFVAVLLGIVMWILLGAFNGLFVLIFLAFYLLAGVGVPILVHLLSRHVGEEAVKVRVELNQVLLDGLQGMADIIAFGQQRRQQARVEELNKRLVSLQTYLGRINGLQSGLMAWLPNLAMWSMLLAAIPLVRSGQLSGVYLALLALATVASFEAIIPLPQAAQQLGRSLEAGRRLFEVIDTQPKVRDVAQPLPLPESFDLAVEQLSFRYAEHEPYVLKEVSFTIPQGKAVALVGPSGAGKSTLANLLLRFWDYQEGEITLGGSPLRLYSQEELHKQIAVVQQQTHLFNGTIRENLLIAKPDASAEEVQAAAKQAQLHDFIETLPQGYETRVGEQGLLLSGGERQRIAIARALLRNAPILILDEPTANLDALTEQAIMQTIFRLLKGRTTLLITHRLVELERVDEILVLQDGEIHERGTQHELMQLEGLYWHLSRVMATTLG